MSTIPNYTVSFTNHDSEGVRVEVTDNSSRERKSIMTLEVYGCWLHGLMTLPSYADRRSVYNADDRKWIVAPLEKLLTE